MKAEKIIVGPDWSFCLGENVWVNLEVGGEVFEATIVDLHDDGNMTIQLLPDGPIVTEPNFNLVRTQVGDYDL
jgi:hypothetical protein